MRPSLRLFPLILLASIMSCGGDTLTGCCPSDLPGLRIVNAFTSQVDVLIDGNVAIAGLATGSVGSAAPTSGSHSLSLRSTNGDSILTSITTAAGALPTIAAVRNSAGALATIALDDTGSVVPVGATKLRVLHLAPNAGILQVYRTQPDYEQPIAWQFPFSYEAAPNDLSAPFYQSSVGSWEVRIWQTPTDASGWANAPVKVVVPLGSGEKRTIVILDKLGGGVQVQVL
jgi:hypothetical protein